MRLEMELQGQKKVSRRLWFVAERAVNLAPAFREINDQLRESEKLLFATQGASGGGWRPLQESTIRSKLGSRRPLVRRNARRTMHATERLMRSLTTKHGKDHIEKANRDGGEFGTRVPYAKYHQPDPQRRRVLQFDRAQRRLASRSIRRYILNGRV